MQATLPDDATEKQQPDAQPAQRENDHRWLLLIHQLPPTPNYLRVKIARRMQRIGAVAIKNTVYALPAAENTLEDFQWTIREVRTGGGEANLFEARILEGLTDGEIRQLFNAAREADYQSIAADARRLLGATSDAGPDDQGLAAEVARLRKRVAEIQAIDFFGAPGQQVAAALIEEVEGRLPRADIAPDAVAVETYRGRTWVTRAGVHVDRMASAWLIRRFIDPEAGFRFVTPKQHRPAPGEIRFDMFEAEFTHDGDRCTFEVLVDRMHLDDRSLRVIAEVVHDIDLKEAKFGRPETPGIAAIVASIAVGRRDDETRISRASAVFDDLYAYYRKKR
jgi:hypothetical protein